MSEEDVQNPASGGAGEAVEPTEPAQPEPNGDPLDDIKDPEARAEAKKNRAIARRVAGKTEPPAPAAPSQENIAKKDDLALVVTNQAKELVSAEVREAWDELLKIPLGGANPMDARSIAQNMSDRFALYSQKQKPADPAAGLAATPGIRGTAGKPPQAVDLKSRFGTKRDADSWGT